MALDDGEAFAEFYESCRAKVFPALVATLGDRKLAQEATDEALTRAAERWGQVRSFDRPEGWVYRTAVNWATSWRRKMLLRPTRQAHQLDQASHDELPDVDLVRQLARLGPQQRQMLVLRFGLGYSVVETAQLLGVAPGTVKSGVHRARQQLREEQEVVDGHR